MSLLIALITTSESPSTIKFSKPSSLANHRTQCAAITSTISTEVGSGIIGLVSYQLSYPNIGHELIIYFH